MELILSVFTHADCTEVEARVDYKIIRESDWYEVGQRVEWRESLTPEFKAEYFIDGNKYVPTPAEDAEWDEFIFNQLEAKI